MKARQLTISRLALLGLVLAFTACADQEDSNATREPDPTTIREIAQGKLIGTRGRDNAMAWYGIPFAQAPVGDLRWRAPRPAPAFSGTFEALASDSRCLQFTSGFEPGFDEGELTGTADCLHLNVWAPATAAAQPLPVMFWIHGGGNVWGFAGQYELGALAQQQNVVVVSANYRLGPLGWFSLQALRDTATTPLDRSANFGTLDLVAALDWVRDNIAAFGGDAGNITVFGESAGGFNTATLLASPLAQGKLHRAIVQSGAFKSSPRELAEAPTPRDDTGTRASANDLVHGLLDAGELPTGLSDSTELAAALRAVSADTLMQRFRALQDGASLFGGIGVVDQIEDGIAIPAGGIARWLNDPEQPSRVPVMLGVNRDEALLLGMGDDTLTNNLFGIVFWPRDEALYAAHGEYPSRLWFALGVSEPARALTASHRGPVYTYRFDWDEQGTTFFTDVSRMVGASHALEIPFVTGGFDDRVSDPLGVYFGEDNRPGRLALSSAMMSYWAEFAYNGHPGTGRERNLPQWQPVQPGDPVHSMVFDTATDGGIRMAPTIDTAPAILGALADDERITTTASRCKVARGASGLLGILGPQHESLQAMAQAYCPEESNE